MNQLGNVQAKDLGDVSVGDVPRGRFDERLVAACGDGTMSGSQGFLRAPYLQRTTTSSTAMVWTADPNNEYEVVVTTPDGAPVTRSTATIDDSAPLPEGAQLVAEIEGLEPDTTYCYQILAGGDIWLNSTGFRTAPDVSLMEGDEPISFVAFGDLGTRTSDQFAVLDQIENVEYDFVLAAGDLAYQNGSLNQFENNFFAVYSDVMREVTFYVSSGNHEYETNDALPFRQVFSLFENGAPEGLERWYSFDWGPIHIAVIDTEMVNRDQISWLERDLQRNSSPWTIVVGHRPPFSSGYHGSSMTVRDAFVPVFERYGVDLAIFGHEHDYERSQEMNGVTYVVSGAGGRGTRNVGSSDFTAFSQEVSHFIHVTIEGDTLTLRAIDATGQMFDSVQITRQH